jgi:hypothetical protein
MDYLPEGFEALAIEKSYVNLSKLPEGEFKFRIVKRPIGGWIDWNEKKPFRYKPDQKPSRSFDEEKPMKPFWVCYVWDYQKEGLFILDINQVSIIKSLTDLGKDEDWGDFTTYDIKIKKQGSGKETKYSVNPVPHKPISEAIKKTVVEKPVRLEALYEGKDPWQDLEGFETPVPRTLEKADFESSLEMLKEVLIIDGFDALELDQLAFFIGERAVSKNQTPEKIAESALLPGVLPLFKRMFREWIDHPPLLQAV